MSESNPALMTLFAEALGLPDPAERAAYLDRVCGGNAALRGRVEALLVAHAGAGRFLEPDAATPKDPTNLAPGATAAFEPAPQSPTDMLTGAHVPGGATQTFGSTPKSGQTSAIELGTVIAGRYTLIETIGEGGMGSVYLASQIEPVKRQVALKLIKAGMDSKSVLARFDSERQALALMDHPNIARIYDGGVTPAGQPYFVMELVKGVPLTEYCDALRLTVDARLQLFVSVCQAVQHAHQKGIIHRDLKPGNVLVTEVDGRPTPKVIDFGVAKATELKLTDLSFSDVGAIVGTPSYMSPEQADPTSMDIDTRTDVYALGVMLYELLTGSPPIDSKQFKHGAILEMLRMVREVEPPRPSTRLSLANALPNVAASRNIEPAKLAKMLQGELDWVVMKALEKDRTRRYDSANGLAQDIQRYLADEVVEARPPSRGYRLKKFVKRNKAQVLAATAVFVLLVAGIIGTAMGLVEARRQEKLAAAESRDRETARREEARQRAVAEARTREAHAAAEEAKKQGDNARTQTEEAKKQAGLARTNAGEARAALDKASNQLERTELALYAAQLARAQHEWQLGNGPRALELLDGCQWNLRDVEFRVLWTLYHSNQRDLTWDAGAIQFIAWSPDGTRVAGGGGRRGMPGTIRLWDAATGRELQTFQGHGNSITSIAVSTDGARVASGSIDGSLRIWDSTTGKELVTFAGHKQWVFGVAFSPDGKRIVSAAGDGFQGKRKAGEAMVWDATTGKALRKFSGHTDSVIAATFAPDGRHVLSGSWDGTAKVWDADTGAEVQTLRGHVGKLHSLAFSPDGKRIVTAGEDGSVRVWNATSGEPEMKFTGHTNAVRAVAFTPDGSTVVSGGSDGSVRLWSLDASKPSRVLQGHRNAVVSVAVSKDGKRIVSGAADTHPETVGEVKVWELTQDQQPRTIHGHTNGVTCLSSTPDDKYIVSGSIDRTVRVWDASRGTEELVLEGHTGDVTSVAISPDNRHIVSGSRDKTIRVWNRTTGKELHKIVAHASYYVECVSISPDNKRVLSCGENSNVKLWDLETGHEIRSFGSETESETARVVAFSPDGRHVFSAGRVEIKVWDVESGRKLLTMRGHTGSITGIAVSQDGKRIVSVANDKTLRIWDASSGEELATLRGHTGFVPVVAFSTDSKRIVSGDSDGTVRVWDAIKGQELLTLPSGAGEVLSVAFSADGRRILAGTGKYDGDRGWYIDGSIRVWDSNLYPHDHRLAGHTWSIEEAAFSPDGKRIVSCANPTNMPSEVKVWDAIKGRELRTLKADSREVDSVAFSSNNKTVACGYANGIIRLWDSDSGAEVKVLQGHKNRITSIAFNSDGTRVVSASLDQTVRVWDPRTGKVIHILSGNGGQVWSAAISPNGHSIAASYSGGPVRSWEMESGRELWTIRGDGGFPGFHAVRFSPDSSNVLAGHAYGNVKVLDASTGRELFTASGKGPRVSNVAFSPDGKYILSGGPYEPSKVWDAKTGKEVDALGNHPGPVYGFSFSRDGRRILGRIGRQLTLWDFDPR